MLKNWLGLMVGLVALTVVGCGSPGTAEVPEEGAPRATQELGNDNQEKVELDPNNY
jgi:hypothetical protein